MLTCPNCYSPLKHLDRMWKCAKGHSFDVAKQGHVNLMLANQKKSANPGDNKVMINARDAFLDTGSFDFLLEGIESIINLKGLPKTENKERATLLDLGCGSGFYTRSLFKKENFNRIGLDISKVAVAKAAVNDKRSSYAVASVFDLPIASRTVDLSLNIFSPIHLEGLTRVLKKGGYFIKVIPMGDHMKEVAELAYDKFIPHTSSIKADITAHTGLEVLTNQCIEKRVSLSTQELHSLITMTPYLYKFTDGKLAAMKEMSVTFSFELVVAKRV